MILTIDGADGQKLVVLAGNLLDQIDNPAAQLAILDAHERLAVGARRVRGARSAGIEAA